VCDLETSRKAVPYIYDISHLRVNERLTLDFYRVPYLNKRYYSPPYVDMYAGLHLYTDSIFYRCTARRKADDIIAAEQLIMPLAE
jgi:hypothetical protein